MTEIDLCHACVGHEIEDWKRLDRAWCLLRALSPAEWPSVLAEGLAGASIPVESKVYPGLGLSRDEGHFLYRDGIVVWSADVKRFLGEHL